MKTKTVCLLLIVIYIMTVFIPSVAWAEERERIDEEQLQEEVIEQLHIDELQSYWNQLDDEYGSFVTELRSKNIVDMLKDSDQLSFKSVSKGIMSFLLYEVITNGKLLGTLIVLTIFATILQTMLTAFEKSTIHKVANFVILIVLLFITLQTFYVAIAYAKDAIDMMSSFIVALFPLMLGIIASFGQFAQVAFFHPIIIILIHFSGILLSKLVFPLLYIAVLLLIISELNDRFKATHLAELFRTVSLTALGIYLAIFLT